MSVFEFAMKMEEDGERFYRELAEGARNEGLKQIFTYLANEEAKHFNLFKGMAEKQDMDYAAVDIMAESKNIFAAMKEKGNIDVASDSEQVDAYRQALEWEEKAYAFFVEKADKTSDAKEKEFLKLVAEEEKRHCRLLEGIIEFVSRPDEWVENAEFNHLTEY